MLESGAEGKDGGRDEGKEGSGRVIPGNHDYIPPRAFTNLGTLPERAYRPCDVVTSSTRSYTPVLATL